MQIKRLATNPLITPDSSASLGDNINGPSIIAVPHWVPNPLGRYYCYFAHHAGSFIRLAYADAIEGPWQIYEPGTLHLDQCACEGHIASPDVHIDHDAQIIRMYFHGVAPETENSNFTGQRSYAAESTDGLQFTTSPCNLGAFYFRVFHHQEAIYAIAKSIRYPGGGVIQRADALDQAFSFGPEIIENMRHAAIKNHGDKLSVFYSKGLDEPERIYCADIRLTDNWLDWHSENEREILRPELRYEGTDVPLAQSQFGAAHGRSQELRDPAYFADPHSGKEYLFYAIAGESGLAAAEILST